MVTLPTFFTRTVLLSPCSPQQLEPVHPCLEAPQHHADRPAQGGERGAGGAGAKGPLGAQRLQGGSAGQASQVQLRTWRFEEGMEYVSKTLTMVKLIQVMCQTHLM